MSVKVGTRKKRTNRYQPARRKIDSRDVPLPANWDNFLALSDSKADVANFLSDELI